MLLADEILTRTSGLADELKLANLRPQIVACQNRFYTRNGIDVVVFGRFKAGKSSFLNHLIGRHVLPIGVVPLTSVITRLRHGPAERAEVRFMEGAQQTVPLEEVGQYVSETGNPNNTRQVAAVDVQLPALQSLDPLQFVDTPGLGSAFTHNTEAALSWLPNVGAALVAISSDAPLSERDLALLEELRCHTPKIILLLTKADLLTEPQRAEVRDFIRRQLLGKWTSELPVFFYSIKPELGELKTVLMNELFIPLMQNHGKAGEQILRHKLVSLVSQTLNYLHIALAAATQAESRRGDLREKLEQERGEVRAFRDELHLLTYSWSATALETFLENLRPRRRMLQQKITEGLQSAFPTWRLGVPAFIGAYGQWVKRFLVEEMNRVSQEEKAMFCDPLSKARLHLTRTLRAFHDRLAAHVETALGLTLAPHEFNLQVREPEAPPVDVSLVFMLPVEVGWLVPMTFFRPLVEHSLIRRGRYEVEKNLSRLAADWQNRIRVGIEELRSQAEQYALNELAALEEMLAYTKSDEPRLRGAIREFDNYRLALESV